MPRFLTMVRIDERNTPDGDPGPEFGERMGALLEEVTKAGVMLDTAGLTPASEGARLTWTGGKVHQTDGPFAESKEVIGGYAILQTRDRAEALEWTRRFLQVHPAQWTVTVEVRQIAEG